MAAYGASNAFVPGRFNVWLPQRTQSAYLSFDTAAEAQAEVTAQQTGVILNPTGQIDPNVQAWSGWTGYQSPVAQPAVALTTPANPAAATVTARPGAAPVIPVATPAVSMVPAPNPRPSAGQFDVYIPQAFVANGVVPNPNNSLTEGAFLPFGTLAEAQAYVGGSGVGVILEPGGAASATQVWAQWRASAPLAQNQRLSATAAANKFNVWFPAAVVGSLGLSNAQPFAAGAYLSFDTSADAQAFVTLRGFGGVVTPKGEFDATQPWPSIASYFGQLPSMAAQLQPKAVAGKYNVWTPAANLTTLGVTNTSAFPNGCFLALDSQQGAQTFVQQHQVGIVVTPQGDADATQPWAAGRKLGAQLSNPRLAARPAAGDFNVWFPAQYVTQLGVANAAPFPNGAFLSFKTEAEAQAHATARGGWGVILDQKGAPAATQVWGTAMQYVVLLSNIDLTAQRTAGKYSVWFPQLFLANLGVSKAASFTAGAYLAFDTAADAQAHARLRGLGVILDPAGKLDATQTWNQAGQFGAQLLNSQLTTRPSAGDFNVWFPAQVVTQLGVANAAAFPNGAYLAFKTEVEAQAHATARGGWGVILDQKGAPAATQVWSRSNQYIVQLSNIDLTAQRTAGKYSVWVPKQYVGKLGVSNAASFSAGAYLAFDTAADAQAHARLRGLGVILDPAGKLDATQTWNQAGQFGAQLLNGQLTSKPRAGDFNVWFPALVVSQLGVANGAAFPNGAYLAFKTEAEAQAHATARGGWGVVLDQKGAPAATQIWGQAAQFGAQLLNDQLSPRLKPGSVNVWFPQQYVSQLAAPNTATFPNGAYLSFATEAQAQAHVTARGGYGVILDGQGAMAATQTWNQASQFVGQLTNASLTAKATSGKFNVWFPQQYVPNLGVNQAAFTTGAYLPFNTAAEAQAHVTQVGYGVILDGSGALDATQPWNQAAPFGAQLLNTTATALPTAGKYNVWFPGAYVASAGLNPTSFTGGAYLPFNTAAEAQAHATQRGFGAVLDTTGALDATQPWSQAAQFGVQLLNSQATPTLPQGKYSVWFPQGILSNLGFGDVTPFPQGAFIAFDSRQEAVAHLSARTMGVLVDDQARLDPIQIWAQASAYVPENPAILPAPPSGWVDGPTVVDATTAQGLGAPTAGSVALGTITPTSKGADIVTYVATVNGTDTFKFSVGAQINGNWTPIFSVPDLVTLPTNGWSQFLLHVDYDAIDAYLKTISPALGVTPGMSSAMGITFTSGHNTGIPGWSSNSGTEKDALMSLPARS